MFAVLEVGGTHVTAALVDPGDLRIVREERTDIDSQADAESLLGAFTDAVRKLEARTSRLVVAIPGPFDYARGIGDFEGVAKFGSLKGVAVGDELAERLGLRVQFVNDVTAYAVGQYARLHQPRRLVTLTLGTGVGSAFLDDGVPITTGPVVPHNGWVYTLTHAGRPIEETFSRRAIIAAYRARTGQQDVGLRTGPPDVGDLRTGQPDVDELPAASPGTRGDGSADVDDIAALAVAGDEDASAVLRQAYEALAETVSPWLIGFRTDVLVIGGSIAQTWTLVERWFTPLIEQNFRRYLTPPPAVVQGECGEEAALIGATLHARRTR